MLLKATSQRSGYIMMPLSRNRNKNAMGSPLGPPLANVFMPSLEEKLESEGNLPVSYRRYVDDTLTLIRPNYSYGLKHPQPGPLFLLSVF